MLDTMNTIITGEESWLSQWRHFTLPRPNKAHQVRSNIKVMLTSFFDSSSIPRMYALQRQRVLKGCRLHDTARCKRRVVVNSASITFLALDSDFFGENYTPMVCQAPYSPDIAPCNFWLYPKLKRQLKGNGDLQRDVGSKVTTPGRAHTETTAAMLEIVLQLLVQKSQWMCPTL
ncbi:hypothetical protein LAZ67_7003625 [Cordylochernes scorpioides]|uniref:Uncharacterized protein n=1 Tax=Cordylochernes scorpioides TaxID=51811 RepID=A0ABY6KU23_9ARAC|nr:hypothetical protein LAZ67_7003625 [Cordylochernes scorpioides]